MYKVNANVLQERLEFICQAGENILSAARKQRIPIPAGCRSGGCGMCKIKVTEGEFNKGRCSVKQLTLVEEKQGYTLACKTYTTSHMTIH